jgi:Nuclease-related domain
MAGESARESARRQREKAERLQRSAELWERGADGEQATADALQALPTTWTVFHDVRWPGRKYANVDHVAAGPGGVFVIDSKNWSGTIEVRDNVLRQNGRQRESAVAGAAEAALAVHSIVPAVVPQHVLGVLCFVRDEPLSGWARDVMVCSTANVVDFLLTRPEVLPPLVVTEACLQLDAMFRDAAGTASAASPRSPARRHLKTDVARPAAAPGTTRPGPRARRRTSRKNEAAQGLIKLAVVAVIAAVFLGNPQVLTAVSDGVTRLVVSELVPKPEPAPTPVTPNHHKKQHRHAVHQQANP